jgi:hypothetical protein
VIVVGILGASGGAVLEIARRAAATGARTEVVGAAPLGDAGDRLLLHLAAAGVGHATVTRSTGPGIEPADLDLALRYLPDVRAIVLVAPAAALLATAAAAAGFGDATLVVVGPVDPSDVDALGAPLPFVLDPPADDPDAAFAGVVAALAARLDAGEEAVAAWRATLADLTIEPTQPLDAART